MNKFMLTTLAAGVLSLGLAGCSATIEKSSTAVSEQPVAAGGEIISVNKDFASPIVPLTGYKKVFIQELDLSETKIISPPWIEKESFSWEVKEENIVYLKKRFKSGVAKGLTENNGRYTVVEKEGEGVLIVDVEIISFMPYALKEDTEISTKGSGEFHLSVQLRDGKTKSLIHIYEATQAIGADYQPNTSMSRAKDAKNLFNSWGQGLRKILDEAR